MIYDILNVLNASVRVTAKIFLKIQILAVKEIQNLTVTNFFLNFGFKIGS